MRDRRDNRKEACRPVVRWLTCLPAAAVSALVLVCLLSGSSRAADSRELPQAVLDRLAGLSVNDPLGYVELAEDILWGDLAAGLLQGDLDEKSRERWLALVRGLAAKSYHLETAGSSGVDQIRVLAAVDEMQQRYGAARDKLRYLIGINPLDHRALFDLDRLDRIAREERDRRDRLLVEIVTLYLAGRAGEALPYMEALSPAERNTFLDEKLIAEVLRLGRQQAEKREKTPKNRAASLPEPDCRFCKDTGLVECEKCRGTGKQQCSRCRGKGHVYEQATKSVPVRRWKKLEDAGEGVPGRGRITVYERTEAEEGKPTGRKRSVWVRVTEMKTVRYSRRTACPLCLGSKTIACAYCDGSGAAACAKCERGRNVLVEMRQRRESRKAQGAGKDSASFLERIPEGRRDRYVRLLSEIARRQAGVLKLEAQANLPRISSLPVLGPTDLIPYDNRAKWTDGGWVRAEKLRMTVQAPGPGATVPSDAEAFAFEFEVTRPVPEGCRLDVAVAATPRALAVADPLLSTTVPPDGRVTLVLTSQLAELRRLARTKESSRLCWSAVLRKDDTALVASDRPRWLGFAADD